MDLSNIPFPRASLKPQSTEAKNNYLTKKPLKVTHKSAAHCTAALRLFNNEFLIHGGFHLAPFPDKKKS